MPKRNENTIIPTKNTYAKSNGLDVKRIDKRA